MAFSLSRLTRSPARHRAPFTCRRFLSSARHARALEPRRSNLDELFDADETFNLLEDDFDNDDTSSLGHLMLRDQRQTLHYLRLIEHQMPKLVGGSHWLVHVALTEIIALAAFRKPFVPPTAETPVIVRSIEYAGEQHPAAAKSTIVVPVDGLPLKNQVAIHKLKLLAGPRWTPNPPADAGVSGLETWGNGYIKISCEDFPKPAQNLKWASDTLDRLVSEANASANWVFSLRFLLIIRAGAER